MYDPTVGRWTTEDPIGLAAGDTNFERYVGNHPTNATDPTGLWEVKATLAVLQKQHPSYYDFFNVLHDGRFITGPGAREVQRATRRFADEQA